MSEESKEQPNMPEGSRTKKRKNGSNSRETLYAKRQQLLREMQQQEDAPIKVREQLEALRKVGSEENDDEERWGDRSKRRKGSQWMLWSVIGLAVPVVVVGLLFLMQSTAPNRAVDGADAINLDYDTITPYGEQLSEQWLYDNAKENFTVAISILETLNQDQVSEETLGKFMRNPQQSARIFEAKSAGVYPQFDLRTPTEIVREFGAIEGKVYMTLMGSRRDFRPFRAYFVKEGDGILFDADATDGWSEISVGELSEREVLESVLVRAILMKEPHFDSRGDEKARSWYQILDQWKEEFVWAYAATHGPVDEKLRERLNYGRVLEDRDRDGERVTLRLSRPRGSRPDEFVVDEFVSKEWVILEKD